MLNVTNCVTLNEYIYIRCALPIHMIFLKVHMKLHVFGRMANVKYMYLYIKKSMGKHITHTWTFYKYRWVSSQSHYMLLCMNNLLCMYVGVDIQWSYAITHWKMFFFLHKTASERSTQRFFISTDFYRSAYTHQYCVIVMMGWECLGVRTYAHLPIL